MRELEIQQTGSVNVEVDSVESVDLTRVLEEMREKYETLVKKNKLELEKWFQSKVRRVGGRKVPEVYKMAENEY